MRCLSRKAKDPVERTGLGHGAREAVTSGGKRIFLLLAFTIAFTGWLINDKARWRGVVASFALRLAACLAPAGTDVAPGEPPPGKN
jgi:hypothetical protein